MREEHQGAVAKLIKKEIDDLAAAGFWKAPRPFEEVDRFLQGHTAEARHRRPILAIIGGTGTGKSLLAASVLQKLAEHHGLSGFLEVTVEDDGHFDMSDLRVDRASRTGPNERREWRRFAPALARGPLQRGPPQPFCCAQSRCHQGCIFGVMSMCEAL